MSVAFSMGRDQLYVYSPNVSTTRDFTRSLTFVNGQTNPHKEAMGFK